MRVFSIFLTVFLSLYYFDLHSQNSTCAPATGSVIEIDGYSDHELNPYCTEYEYRASNRILITNANGKFSLKPIESVTNPTLPAQSRHLIIDPTTVFNVNYVHNPKDPADRDLDYNLPVGTVQGVVDVSPTGAATYTIPIFSPPGTAGMEPQFAISYNSQSGIGLLGLGWDLEGVSTISRVSKNYFYDNNVEPVKLNSGDHFSLDGIVLDLVSGTYGADGSVYATELDNFSKITAYGVSGTGPAYFIVETKDGHTLYYGDNANSTASSSLLATNSNDNGTVLQWRLYKVADQFGNSMEYYYTAMNDGQSVVSEIKYTINQNANISAYNSIKFIYDKRTVDPNYHFIAGNRIADNYVLSGIKCIHQDTLVKEYNFKYISDQHVTKLYEIIEYGQDRSHYNSTLIKWGSENQTVFETEPQMFDTYPTEAVYKTLVTNLNNDGYSDVVLVTTATQIDNFKYYAYIGSENGFTLVDSEVLGGYYVDAFVLDNNGDNVESVFFEISPQYYSMQTESNVWGLFSMIWGPFNTIGAANLEEVYFMKFDYNAGTQTLYSSSFESYFTDSPLLLEATDLTGDGKDEILVVNTANEIIEIRNGNIELENWISLPQVQLANLFNHQYALDFNGDGKNELLTFIGSYIHIYEYSTELQMFTPVLMPDGNPLMIPLTGAETIMPGDFNGDGKSDLLVNNPSTAPGTGSWYIIYSTGKDMDQIPATDYFSLPSSGTTPVSSPWNNNYYVADFNGDGKSDIMCIYQTGSTISQYGTVTVDIDIVQPYRYFKNGNLLETSFITDTYSDIDVNVDFLSSLSLTFADANADGKADLLWENDNANQMSLFMHRDEKSRLVQSIFNGLNNEVRFDYYSLPKYANYVKESISQVQYGIYEFNNPLYVVGSMYSPNGIGDEFQSNYFYTGGRYSNKGLGFLGFNVFSQVNTETHFQTSLFYENKIIVETSYNRHYARNNFKVDIRRINTPSSSSPISTTEYFYTNVLTNNGKTIFSYPDYIVETNHLNGTFKTTNSVVNSDGNTTSMVTEAYIVGNSTPEVTKTTNSIYTSILGWHVPSLIDFSTETVSRDGNTPYIQSTNFTYNPLGSLIEMVSYYGKPKAVTTTFGGFTPCGQYTTQAVSASDIQTRTVSYEFDDLYRFIISSSDPYMNTTYTSYDGNFGIVKRTKSLDNLVTEYKYNGYGAPISITTPDNNTLSASLHWVTNGQPANAVYYSIAQIPGKGTANTWFDILGRDIQTRVDGFEDDVYSEKVFNSKGQLVSISEPHYPMLSGIKYTTHLYDDFLRLAETSYNGLPPTLYTYNLQTSTITSPDGKVSSKTVDAIGLVKTATDNGGNIGYFYNSQNLPVTVTYNGSSIVNEYDDYGNLYTTTDPNIGQIEYEYNSLGELIEKTDAKNNEFTYTYDLLGRILTETDQNNLTTTYTYVTSGNGTGQLLSQTLSNNTSTTYVYDNLGRPISVIDNILGQNYYTSFAYDQHNRISELTYPTGFAVKYCYNTIGYMIEVLRADNNELICHLDHQNAIGQPEEISLGVWGVNNNLTREYTYDSYNYISGITTKLNASAIQDYGVNFDPLNGNVNSRNDYTRGLIETFSYDNLDRLLTATINNQAPSCVNYSPNGNISDKTDVGIYSYDPTRVHAVYQVSDNTGSISPETQTISYNTSNYVTLIDETVNGENRQAEFIYGPDKMRRIMYEKTDGSLSKTIKYSGHFEEVTDEFNTITYNHYIYGPDGLTALYQIVDDESFLYFTGRDHLGSITHYIDQSGQLVEEVSYDAWGRRRNANDWTFNNIPALINTQRGYTGHEHLETFDIINMNGRLYDPILGRMLSPDPLVQSPGYTQNYNRYSYCWNNPLKYTDPSGFAVKPSAYYTYSEQEMWRSYRQETLMRVVNSNLSITAIRLNGQGYRGAFDDAMWEAFRNYRTFTKNGGTANFGEYAFGLYQVAQNPNEYYEGYGFGLYNAGGVYKSYEFKYHGKQVLETVFDEDVPKWGGKVRYGRGSLSLVKDEPVYTSFWNSTGAMEGFANAVGWDHVVEETSLGIGKYLFLSSGSTSTFFRNYLKKEYAVMTRYDNLYSGSRLKINKMYLRTSMFNIPVSKPVVNTSMKVIKIGGYGLGLYNYYSVESQYRQGEISNSFRWIEHGSNTITTFGGIYGAAWGIGWEAGRWITERSWYQNWYNDSWLPWRENNLGY